MFLRRKRDTESIESKAKRMAFVRPAPPKKVTTHKEVRVMRDSSRAKRARAHREASYAQVPERTTAVE